MHANRPSRLLIILVWLVAPVAALWLWHCWCVFPALPFNEARLEASFVLAQKLPLYPLPGEGPVTTWIYGPVPPIIFLPATFAPNASSALLIGGFINITIVVGSIAAVAAWWPTDSQRNGSGANRTLAFRTLAFLLCVAIWPWASLQFIQADNIAIGFGLLSNLAIIRTRPQDSSARWAAAILAIGAIACKQTSLGVGSAQVVWLVFKDGWKSAAAHGFRILVVGVAAAFTAIIAFGPKEVWFGIIHIPTSLPWTDQWLRRAWDLAPFLAIHLGIPIGLFIVARNSIWKRDSALLLPALTWMTALLPGLASLYKLGGSLNSLQSFLLFIPPTLVVLICVSSHSVLPRIGVALLTLGVFAARLVHSPGVEIHPKVHHIKQAEILAAQFPNRLWFPWNPIISYYADHRLYHAEDGFFVRFVTREPVTLADAKAHLPESWSAMAILKGTSDWGFATRMIPPDATQQPVGLWNLYTWEPKPSTKQPSQNSPH